MDYYEIGQRIRKVRKARGLSQEKLAEEVGISTTHMSHIETGNTKMSLPTFVALATVLGVHTDELLFDKVSMERSDAVTHIVELLEQCTVPQLRLIEDIVKAAKESFQMNPTI